MQHAPHQLETYLQTDVVMYPGFSGGPLVDVAGQVRGLNTSIVRGISLAIPTPTVRRVAQSLLEHGRVRRGYLGITSQPVALPENFKQELEQETGLLIIAVEPDSPAAHGGLLLGDTVVGLDDQAIAGMDDLLALLSGDRVGSEVPVHVIRGGELKNIAVTIGERP
jgi:S1-C subfamily serine protease